MDINESYEELILPNNLIKNIHDFREWLKLAECKKDLEDTLLVFQEEEMYEECIIIKEAINNYDR